MFLFFWKVGDHNFWWFPSWVQSVTWDFHHSQGNAVKNGIPILHQLELDYPAMRGKLHTSHASSCSSSQSNSLYNQDKKHIFCKRHFSAMLLHQILKDFNFIYFRSYTLDLEQHTKSSEFSDQKVQSSEGILGEKDWELKIMMNVYITWWLVEPSPLKKICASQNGWKSSPMFGVKMPKNIWVATTHFRMLTPRWCHHQVSNSSRESQAEAIHFRHTRTECPTCVVNLPNMRSIGVWVYRNVKMSLFLIEGLVK